MVSRCGADLFDVTPAEQFEALEAVKIDLGFIGRAGIFGGFACVNLAGPSHLRAEPSYRESTTSAVMAGAIVRHA